MKSLSIYFVCMCTHNKVYACIHTVVLSFLFCRSVIPILPFCHSYSAVLSFLFCRSLIPILPFSHSYSAILSFPGSDADTGEPSAYTGDLWGSEWRRLQKELLEKFPEDGRKVFAARSGEKVIMQLLAWFVAD